MANLLNRRSGPAALASVVLAGLVIGCGGGGGGGGSNNNGGNGGNDGGSNGTVTPPGSTSGGAGSLNGSLPQNSVFYAESTGAGTGTYDVKYVKEDGTGAGIYATAIPAGASATAPNPAVAGQFVFAAKPSGASGYGLYKGTVASPTDANTTQILAPTLGQILSIQVSRDGSKAIYIGASSVSATTYSLYAIDTSGAGAPATIDTAVESASISADGTKVVYSKNVGDTELYVRFLSESASTRLTNNDLFDDDPQFSKDGTKVVFSQSVPVPANDPDAPYRARLATLTLTAPYTVTTFDPVPTSQQQRAPSFNSAGTRVSFVVVADNAAQNGIWTANVDGSDARQVVSAVNILNATYWSTPQGRSLAGQTLNLSRGPKR